MSPERGRGKWPPAARVTGPFGWHPELTALVWRRPRRPRRLGYPAGGKQRRRMAARANGGVNQQFTAGMA
ncbi:hypothetical protein MMAN_13800 [Mycobacterium mantenii]|uniref:Uncharacterized protein n=1 Tax=Mycobacterium mantenii TaxID=560555 RepID=A0ABM7JNW6_MYCNT|nr:hypothetical protein MMAN_13800 [Mycobacterium mantenii]